MQNGGMQGIITGTYQEKLISKKLNEIDKTVLALRDDVRNGKQLEKLNFEFSNSEYAFI